MKFSLLVILGLAFGCVENDPPPTRVIYVPVKWHTYSNHEPTYNGWEQYTNTMEEYIPIEKPYSK